MRSMFPSLAIAALLAAMGVAGLALGARVEMECWAHAPQKKAP